MYDTVHGGHSHSYVRNIWLICNLPKISQNGSGIKELIVTYLSIDYDTYSMYVCEQKHTMKLSIRNICLILNNVHSNTTDITDMIWSILLYSSVCLCYRNCSWGRPLRIPSHNPTPTYLWHDHNPTPSNRWHDRIRRAFAWHQHSTSDLIPSSYAHWVTPFVVQCERR